MMRLLEEWEKLSRFLFQRLSKLTDDFGYVWIKLFNSEDIGMCNDV
jgi:hypothetical protein